MWKTINSDYYNCTLVQCTNRNEESLYLYTVMHKISHQTISVYGMRNAFYAAKLLDLEYRVTNWLLSSERRL